MYPYTLESRDRAYSLNLDISFLQGFYAAQVLAGAESLIERNDSTSIMGNIGMAVYGDGYAFTLAGAKDPAEDSIVQIHRQSDGYEAKFIDPINYPIAFDMHLSDPLLMNPINASAMRQAWDTDILPYPLRQNFETSLGNRINREMDDTFKVNGRDKSKMFSRNPSKVVSSQYYIGTESDARNTFLVPVFSANTAQFLRGFVAFPKWAISAGGIIDDNATEITEMPEFYMYTYGEDVTISAEMNNQSLTDKLPVLIESLNIVG